MKILDRFLIKEFLKYFFGSIVVFSFLFFLVDILQQMMRWGFSNQLVYYESFQLPWIISQMIPMSCLIASMFTLTTLAKNAELVALYACGISLERISASLLTLAVVIGISNFFISDIVVPVSLKKSRWIYNHHIRQDPSYRFFKSQKIWYRGRDAIYNIDYFDTDKKEIQGLNIYLFDDHFTLIEQIQAEGAVYQNEQWELHNGLSTTYIDDFPITHHFKNKIAHYITEKPGDLKELSNLETLSFEELRTYVKKNKKAGFDTTRHEVNLHAKIAYVMACLLMVFLGIPFSTKNPRSGALALSFGSGLIIAFAYWISLNTGLSLGYNRTLPPILSAWITNFIFAFFGYYILRQQQRNKKLWPF
ncbi:MAG: LPS export ABC transporter permease LptG [Deltaproteobacteria bacterium]|nr:LPS export ABC transporter permease LptG [Deltaproteobacteria bacterium]